MLLQTGINYSSLLINNISASCKFKCYIVGSIRRKLSHVDDIDILIYTKNKKSLDEFDIPEQFNIISRGPRKMMLTMCIRNKPVQFDIFYAYGDELPYALLHYTGSKLYNIRLRRLAKLNGYTLNQYGLIGSHKKFKTEEEIITFLGSKRINPSDRND